MMTKSLDLTSDYRAALEGAVYYPVPRAGYLRVVGEGEVDFIQRQTTNDLTPLTESRCVTTVLTSSVARIVDVLQVVREPHALGLITLPGNTEKTAAFLKSRIFFMDKVIVEDASPQFAQIDLEGPEAHAVLTGLGVNTALGLDELAEISIGAGRAKVIARHGLAADLAYRLLLPVEAQAEVLKAFENASVPALSEESREILRVEHGLPKEGHELTEDYTPLEANLDWAISTEKGCYTGQEVIARQINYDKIAKRLVQLRLDGEAKVGDAVRVEGKNMGVITSVALSPRLGWLALAVIRQPHNQDGAIVEVGEGDAHLSAKVVSLVATSGIT